MQQLDVLQRVRSARWVPLALLLGCGSSGSTGLPQPPPPDPWPKPPVYPTKLLSPCLTTEVADDGLIANYPVDGAEADPNAHRDHVVPRGQMAFSDALVRETCPSFEGSGCVHFVYPHVGDPSVTPPHWTAATFAEDIGGASPLVGISRAYQAPYGVCVESAILTRGRTVHWGLANVPTDTRVLAPPTSQYTHRNEVVLLRGPAATASVFTWTKLDVWHSKGSLTPTAVPSGNLIYGDEGAVVIEAADGTATLHALDGSVELLLPHARDPLLSVICNEKVRSVESDGRTITSRLEVGLKVTEEFQFPSAVTPVALLNNQYLLTWDENAPDEYQVRSARPAMDGVEVVGLKLEHTFPHHLPVERIRSTACSQDGRINFVDGTVRRTYLFQDLGIPASRYTVISSPADAEFLGMVDLDWNAETAVAVRRGDDFYLYGDVGAP